MNCWFQEAMFAIAHKRARNTSEQGRKHTFDESEESTRIQGLTNTRKPPKLIANHHVPTWGPTWQCPGWKTAGDVAPKGRPIHRVARTKPKARPDASWGGGAYTQSWYFPYVHMAGTDLQHYKRGTSSLSFYTPKFSSSLSWRCSAPMQRRGPA